MGATVSYGDFDIMLGQRGQLWSGTGVNSLLASLMFMCLDIIMIVLQMMKTMMVALQSL